MQQALRPYATAGVALVGASVIAVSPVTVPPSAIQEVRDSAVQLSALANPIDVFRSVFEQELQNAQTLGQTLADNPAPILKQVLANQLAQIANFPEALQAQIKELPQLPGDVANQIGQIPGSLETLAGLSQTFLENVFQTVTGGPLQDQLQLVLDSLKTGDFGGAFTNFVLTGLLLVAGNGLENLALLPQLVSVLQQPLADAQKLLPIAAGPLGNAEAVLGALPTAGLILGLGVLGPVISTGAAAGNILSGLVDAAHNSDPEAAFNAIVNGAGAVTQALVDGVVGPGGIVAVVQQLRETIAEAIGATPPAIAEAAKLPSTAAQSFTLTAPLEKAPAPKAATSSGAVDVGTPDSGTAAKDSAGAATTTDTKGNLKGGNLFVPGGDAGKGGRHRADNGPSFGQELRDAAAKTIKGLTGPGRGGQSDSSTAGTSGKSESGSASSGSGSSGSGSSGGTGSK